MRSHYRALWISDVHLGTPACRAEDLARFLSTVSADVIYLVGDIIDLEAMKVDSVFPDSHRIVVETLFRIAAGDTEVFYVPGNHDAAMRKWINRHLGGVRVLLEAEHITRRNESLLVTHGDLLDAEIRHGTGLGKFGAAAYKTLVKLDVSLNQLRQRFGGDYFPLSAYVKSRIRLANQYIARFEETVAKKAALRGFDGVVCGHIHRPCVRKIAGIRYANDGDWVEHRTALAELSNGDLKLLHFENDAIAAGSPAMQHTKAA
tara:strand:+ start:535 stop:1317 length:783 start_codon:yes stop_codon:yes gene_type:complete